MDISFVKNPFEAIERLGEREALMIPIKLWRLQLMHLSRGKIGSVISEEGVRPLPHVDLIRLMNLYIGEAYTVGRVFLFPQGLINSEFYKIKEKAIKSEGYLNERAVKKLRTLEVMLKNDLFIISQDYDYPISALNVRKFMEIFLDGVEKEDLVDIEKEKEETYKKLLENISKDAKEYVKSPFPPKVLIMAKEVVGEIDEEELRRNPLLERWKKIEYGYGTFKTKTNKEVLFSLIGKPLYEPAYQSFHLNLYQVPKDIHMLDRAYISPLVLELESEEKEGETLQVLIGFPMVVVTIKEVESEVRLNGISIKISDFYKNIGHNPRKTDILISEKCFNSTIVYANRENVETRHSSGGLLEVTIRDYVDLNVDTCDEEKCDTHVVIDKDNKIDYVDISCNMSADTSGGKEAFLEKMNKWEVGRKKFIFSGFIEDRYEYAKQGETSIIKTLIRELGPEEKEKIGSPRQSIAEHITRLTEEVSLIVNRERYKNWDEGVNSVLTRTLTEEKRQKALGYLHLIKDLCFPSEDGNLKINHPVKEIANSRDEEDMLSRDIALELLGLDPKKLEGSKRDLKEMIKASLLSIPFMDEYEFYTINEEIDSILEENLKTENISPRYVEVMIKRDMHHPHYGYGTKVLVIFDKYWARVYVRSRKQSEERFKMVRGIKIEAGGLTISLYKNEQN